MPLPSFRSRKEGKSSCCFFKTKSFTMKRKFVSEDIPSCSSSLSLEVVSTHEYDIFLSFRGVDTRPNFTSHLYNNLTRVGFRVYKDDIEMKRGEYINDDLRKAISSSKVCIPIFSKGYASSKACLRELSYMLDCKKEIIPIFYNVMPDDVKLKTRKYKDALRKHQGHVSPRDEIEKWKKALIAVAAMSGYNIANKNEADEITSITKNLMELMPKDQDLTDPFINVDEQVEQVKNLLHLNPGSYRIIVIHGLGGIGKTTLAKVIYNKLHSSFDGCSFLENVRENLNLRRHVELQQQLYANIVDPKLNSHITSPNGGIIKLKLGLRNKKILLVLDDIENAEQLQELLGNEICFAKGSRIIVTTRNKKILHAIKQKYQEVSDYKVEEMKHEQALELFRRSAFNPGSPLAGYESLCEDVISYTGGLPLAIKVIGSLLYDKEKDAWEDTLKELRTSPEDKIRSTMMTSYKALSWEEKNIFLEIANYPGDLYKEYACYMWDDKNWCPNKSIQALVNLSLINIVHQDVFPWKEYEFFRMHDVLKDFGRDIVRERNETNSKSPLSLHIRENLDDLPEKEERSRVEILIVDAPTITITRDDMDGLRNLKFLVLEVQKVVGDFDGLFPNLRVLWCTKVQEFHPTNFNPKILIVLDLAFVNSVNWEGMRRMKVDELKVLRLHRWGKDPPCCPPDVDFNYIVNATNLQALSVRIGHIVIGLMEIDKLQKITELTLVGAKIQSLTHLPYNLLYLQLHFCDFDGGVLDASNFKKLISLGIAEPENLNGIKGLENLCSLKKLTLIDINNLQSFGPTEPNIKNILIQGYLKTLIQLRIGGCDSIKEFPDVSSLKSLYSLFLWRIERVVSFNGHESLKELFFIYCPSLETLPDLSTLRKLQTLSFWGCDELKCIQGIPQLESLEYVEIAYCDSLELSELDKKKLENVPSVCIAECAQLPDTRKGFLARVNMPNYPLGLLRRLKST